MKNRQTAGDTIIEVLLAMAVAISVMAGAYVLATRSMRIGRLAQERTEATKLAQGQIEALESLARAGILAKDESDIPDAGDAGTWCLPTWSSDWTTTPTAQKAQQSTATNAICERGLYTISLVKEVFPGFIDPNKVIGGQYKVEVNWPGLTNMAQNVTLRYRTYEDIPD